jgi:hypothetical protein
MQFTPRILMICVLALVIDHSTMTAYGGVEQFTHFSRISLTGQEEFWLVGNADVSWRVYADRIVTLESVYGTDDSVCLIRVTDCHVASEGIRVLPRSEYPMESVGDDSTESYAQKYIASTSLYATCDTMYVFNGETLAGTVYYDIGSRCLVIDERRSANSHALFVGENVGERVQEGITWLGRRAAPKSTDDVLEDIKSVLISDPRVPLATYIESWSHVDIDPQGKLLISSRGPFFSNVPISPGLIDPEIGEWIVRTTKVDLDLNVDWSVYVGPGGFGHIRKYAPSGDIVHVLSTGIPLFKTQDSYSPTPHDGLDCAIGKWDKDGRCQWYTFVGGARDDIAKFVELGPNGDIYVLFETNTYDVALACISSDGKRLLWCTYLSTPDAQQGDTIQKPSGAYAKGLVIDSVGDLFVTYYVNQPQHAITTEGAYSTAVMKGAESTLMKISADGDLMWSTLLNSDADDIVHDMHLDPDGSIVVRLEQYVSTYGTRFSKIKAVGVPGTDSTVIGYPGLVYKFSADGVPVLVWSIHSTLFSATERGTVYSQGYAYSIITAPATPKGDTIYYEPHASARAPNVPLLLIVRNNNYFDADTLLATPVLGSLPQSLSVGSGLVALVDNANMPYPGACVTDTTWFPSTVQSNGKQSYLVVLRMPGTNTVVDDVPSKPDCGGEGIAISPNPCISSCTIFLPAASDKSVSVMICDMQGRQVHRDQVIALEGQVSMFDCLALAPGSYYVIVTQENRHCFAMLQVQ